MRRVLYSRETITYIVVCIDTVIHDIDVYYFNKQDGISNVPLTLSLLHYNIV